MKLPALEHNGKRDPMLTLVFVVVILSGIKFIFDGVTISILGHVISFSHTDGGTYAAFLGPTLGAHSFTSTRNNNMMPDQILSRITPDDPDLEV